MLTSKSLIYFCRKMNQELRVASLFLRRRQAKESARYTAHLPYDASDYEVLLRLWPSEPFKSYLGAFSGPAIPGEEPEETLLRESKNWAAKMAGLSLILLKAYIK